MKKTHGVVVDTSDPAGTRYQTKTLCGRPSRPTANYAINIQKLMTGRRIDGWHNFCKTCHRIANLEAEAPTITPWTTHWSDSSNTWILFSGASTSSTYTITYSLSNS